MLNKNNYVLITFLLSIVIIAGSCKKKSLQTSSELIIGKQDIDKVTIYNIFPGQKINGGSNSGESNMSVDFLFTGSSKDFEISTHSSRWANSSSSHITSEYSNLKILCWSYTFGIHCTATLPRAVKQSDIGSIFQFCFLDTASSINDASPTVPGVAAGLPC